MCPRTHASRIAPHDKIVDLVDQALTRKSYSISREPAIPTPAGICKPDLVVACGSAVTVLDVTVVADNADLALSHGWKCEYYDTLAVHEGVSGVFFGLISFVTLERRSWIVNRRLAYRGGQYDDV